MTEVQAQPPQEAYRAPEVSSELDEFLNWSPGSSDVAGLLQEAKQLIDDIHRLSNERKFEELLLTCSKVSLYLFFLLLCFPNAVRIMTKLDIMLRCEIVHV